MLGRPHTVHECIICCYTSEFYIAFPKPSVRVVGALRSILGWNTIKWSIEIHELATYTHTFIVFAGEHLVVYNF